MQKNKGFTLTIYFVVYFYSVYRSISTCNRFCLLAKADGCGIKTNASARKALNMMLFISSDLHNSY